MSIHDRCKVLVNFLVLLVTGGYSTGSDGTYIGSRTSVELLSSDGTRLCSLPNLPAERYQHSQTGLVACGGGKRRSSEVTSCVTFAGGRWKRTHTLGQKRHSHTAWASPRGVLLMGGKYSRRTTELLTDNGHTTPSFNLGLAKHQRQ